MRLHPGRTLLYALAGLFGAVAMLMQRT